MQSAEPQAVERQCELQPQLTPAGVKHAYVDLYNIRANSCGSRYTLIQTWDWASGSQTHRLADGSPCVSTFGSGSGHAS